MARNSNGNSSGNNSGNGNAYGRSSNESDRTESSSAAADDGTQSYEMTAYKWAGFTEYDESVEMTVTDDDDQMDWYGQDTGQAETAEIDGETFSISMTGTIKTSFTDSEGQTHTEDFTYTYTSDGYYFIPPPGSSFDEGSTLNSFPDNRWEDTSGVNYEEVVCFTPGCQILTDKGLRPAAVLKPGDLIQTADNGVQRIKWVGRSDLPALRRVARNLHPIRIRKGAFGDGCPNRDIHVSPQHRFCLNGTDHLFGEPEMLAAAKTLIDGVRVEKVRSWAGVSYVHILFDRHELINCNGLWTESFQPAKRSLKTLSPDMAGALAKVIGTAPAPMRAARSALKPWEVPVIPPERIFLSARPMT